MEKVLILGASSKKDRYSYKAKVLLEQYGHTTILVHPKETEIEGQKVHSDLSTVKEKIDTLTMYIRPELSSKIIQEIVELKPKRVIFNPGTENHELYQALNQNGLKFEEACTLVLLDTGQF